MEAAKQAAPQIVRPNKAAAMLGISLSTLKRLVAAGRLEKVSISTRAVGIPLESINRMLNTPKSVSVSQ